MDCKYTYLINLELTIIILIIKKFEISVVENFEIHNLQKMLSMQNANTGIHVHNSCSFEKPEIERKRERQDREKERETETKRYRHSLSIHMHV